APSPAAATSTPGCIASRSGASAGAPGRGSIATSSATGTSAQAAYATCGPKARRSGIRSASTIAVAMLAASVPSIIQRSSASALIVDLPDQPAQLVDVFLAELAALAEVRHQRRHPAAKQPVQHALALAGDPGVAGEHGRIQVAPAIALSAHRTLLQQAVEQGLDGGLGPVA